MSNKIKLKINGDNIELDNTFMDNIIEKFDDIPKNLKLFETLSLSTKASILYTIADKKHINKKIVTNLLRVNNEDIYRILINNQEACKYINFKKLKKIMNSNIFQLNDNIARNIHYFTSINSNKLVKYLLEVDKMSIIFNLYKKATKDNLSKKMVFKIDKQYGEHYGK